MRTLKVKPVARLLLLLTSLSLVSFKPEAKTPVNCLIVVGIATKDYTCKRSGQAVAFPTVIGYQSIYRSSSDEYYSTANYVKSLLATDYKVSEKNITLYSSEKSKSVIIQYRQKIEDWSCYVNKCAVGFGESEEQALADAVAQKNAAVGEKTPYLKLGSTGCGE
jgi:hypothetical protein